MDRKNPFQPENEEARSLIRKGATAVGKFIVFWVFLALSLAALALVIAGWDKYKEYQNVKEQDLRRKVKACLEYRDTRNYEMYTMIGCHKQPETRL
ncbi:hypothetical protein CHELA1G11_11994 [Hyphomicrobiales bacterium]|nr:hypothetical protein CHELA1G11_11994 [Hyphomicrobiales bacterium]CAH1664031.1 hypothetical protein CHELA1G2_12318 [Hyphomicrobiales bacterium]